MIEGCVQDLGDADEGRRWPAFFVWEQRGAPVKSPLVLAAAGDPEAEKSFPDQIAETQVVRPN